VEFASGMQRIFNMQTFPSSGPSSKHQEEECQSMNAESSTASTQIGFSRTSFF
jgi:hypothetical protein